MQSTAPMTLVAAALAAAIAVPAPATIIVSGDTSITHALVGSEGAKIDVGNQQFFLNVVGPPREGKEPVIVVLETFHEGSEDAADQDVILFFVEFVGIDADLIQSPITAQDLTGPSLLFIPLPNAAFTQPEIDAIAGFLAGGGTLFITGENSNFRGENNNVNGLLEALGSNMQIVDDLFDVGFTQATGDQIADDPLTAGLETFTYNASSRVEVPVGGGGPGATFLFFGTKGQPFLAYEPGGFEDCNDNGIPDDQDIADGTSTDCNDNQIPDECDIADGTSMDANGNGLPDECEGNANFDPPQGFGAAGEPSIEAAGDMDGDEDNDVVLAIPAESVLDRGEVQVFINLGNVGEAWQGLAPNDPVEVGRDPSGVALGSFNSNFDDDLDVAVTNREDGTVTILLNDGTGDGALTPQEPAIPVGVAPSSVTVADFNEDALTDLGVALEGEDTFVILFGDGAGGFAAPLGSGVGGLGFSPVALFADDFDNNKCPDLTGAGTDAGIGAGSDPQGKVFVGLGMGDGQFIIMTYDVGLFPTDLCTGDINLDGFTDILTSNSGDDSVSILINAGNGTFLPAIQIPIPVGILPRAVDCADLSGDGVADLAVVLEVPTLGPFAVVLQNTPTFGGGGVDGSLPFDFSPPIPFPLPAEATWVVATELNMDGNNDLVMSTLSNGQPAGVTTLLGNPDPISEAAVLDVRPGECPNPVNVADRGFLPVAIVGTEGFDVSEVIPSSITIARANGVGSPLAPAGTPPSIHDVATPLDMEPCACHDLGGDGTPDLVVNFSVQQLVVALALPLSHVQEVEVVLTGTRFNGTIFSAVDCITIIPAAAPTSELVVTAQGAAAFIDVSPPDQLLNGGGHPTFQRQYAPGTVVTLSAPLFSNGRLFLGWAVDDPGFLGGNGLLALSPVIDVHLQNQVHRVEAVYAAWDPFAANPAPTARQE